MKTEETKNTGAKGESADSGCCNPENFHKMFEKMNKCCIGQDDFSDFSARKGNCIILYRTCVSPPFYSY